MSRSKRQFRGRLKATALLVQVEVQLIYASVFPFLSLSVEVPHDVICALPFQVTDDPSAFVHHLTGRDRRTIQQR